MLEDASFYARVGKWMREWREDSGLTIEEVASGMKWSPEKVRRIEAGEGITVDELKGFAHRFSVSLEELIDTVLESYLGRR